MSDIDYFKLAKFPLNPDKIDVIIKDHNKFQQFWNLNINIYIKIHVLCCKLLFVRNLRKTRVNLVGNKYEENIIDGAKDTKQIQSILNSKFYSYTCYDNYIWPLCCIDWPIGYLFIQTNINHSKI